MAENWQINLCPLATIRSRSGQLVFFRVVFQISAPRSRLPSIPEGQIGRVLFGDGEQNQDQNQQVQTDKSSLILEKLERMTIAFENAHQISTQRDAASEAKMAAAMELLTAACTSLAEVGKKLTAGKTDNKYYVANGDKPIEFNWMLGHGRQPKKGKKSTPDQVKFNRVKGFVRSNAIFFIYDASEEELDETWIQFGDEPQASVDGHYIKQILRLKAGMTDDWANIVFRVLRYDEAVKRVGVDENCHYVLHYWAEAVMAGNTSEDERQDLFLNPAFDYDIANCGRVVAMFKLEDAWGSLSIDLKNGRTLLIYPELSGTPYLEVLEQFKPMMQILTNEAVHIMKKLANTKIPDGEWVYDVAIKRKHAMHGPESGTSTAYYSIPKKNQFLSVSAEIIYLAKLTFIHSAIKICFSNTKKSVQRSKKPPTSKKRGADGHPINDIRQVTYWNPNSEEVGPVVPRQALDYLL